MEPGTLRTTTQPDFMLAATETDLCQARWGVSASAPHIGESTNLWVLGGAWRVKHKRTGLQPHFLVLAG